MSGVSFRQVDVFTTVPFRGNPVAVVMDAQTLSGDQMQAIAAWTNLSETTFVLPAEDSRADYRVRIFTPGRELPFAGHPTIGTAHALLEAGMISAEGGRIIQECGAGLVTLAVSEENSDARIIAFELPEPSITNLNNEQVTCLEDALGCQLDRTLTPALVDVGARWIVARVASVETVLQAQPHYGRLAEHDSKMNVTGVCLYAEYGDCSGMNIEVRSFAPSCGVSEDPVCGSGNGSVAAFMRHHQVALPAGGRIHSSQGRVLGRNGKIQLTTENGKILVGGSAVTCISGTVSC